MAAADQSAVLSSLFSELSALGKSGEYEKALRIANKILDLDENDEDAFHCKVVCLIQLDRFDDALKFIHKNESMSRKVQFERAYCEYRLNQVQEAAKTLRYIPNHDVKCKELLAQVLYRLEEYEECLEVYKDVIRNSDDNYESERETNLAAVLASLQRSKPQSNLSMEDFGIKQETYETVYNTACLLLGRGDTKAALEKLKEAEELCKEMLAEEADDGDISAEDLDAELALLRVQMAYGLQLQGKPDEAMKLYNLVAKQRPADLGVAAVTANNIITINKEQNVFDSKKRIRVATADNVKHKLNREQKRAIAMNNCLLLLYMNQYDQCKRSVASLVQQFPAAANTGKLLEAAILVREKKVGEAISLVKENVNLGGDEISLLLALAQLQLQQGSISQACQTLKASPHLCHAPGIVSTLVTLYSHIEDTELAEKCLWEAVTWYKKKQPGTSETKMLMKQCASYMMKNAKYKDAAKLFEELRKLDSSDSRILAQLISAYSHFDPQRAQQLSSDLPSADEMAASVDGESLENSGLLLSMKYGRKERKTDSPNMAGEPGSGTADTKRDKVLKKKKRKKKGPLPKNYDASVDPDPERWLPKWERSTFNKKKRGGRRAAAGADVSKGTQGSSAATAALASELDASTPPHKSPPTPGSPKSPGLPTNTTGPRQQKPAAASSKQKKKKKGGSKW